MLISDWYLSAVEQHSLDYLSIDRATLECRLAVGVCDVRLLEEAWIGLDSEGCFDIRR